MTDKKKKEEPIKDWVKKAIDLLVHKQISESVILSSYKINSVLKSNYGIDIRVDRIGRVLSRIAKQKNLKRLSTNIPKYQVSVKEYIESENSNLDHNPDNKQNNINTEKSENNPKIKAKSNESSEKTTRIISRKEVKRLLGENVENK